MESRCPSWCDRIFFNQLMKTLIDESKCVVYDMIGKNTCMGDHKVR